jgi:hypothetical protein
MIRFAALFILALALSATAPPPPAYTPAIVVSIKDSDTSRQPCN